MDLKEKMKQAPLEQRWEWFLDKLTKLIGKRPQDVEAIIYLIGVQELGQGFRTFSKEEKQDLMHIATCRLLSKIGFFELEGHDKDGWPHWKKLKNLPFLNHDNQEDLLKTQIMDYFEEEEIF